MTTATKPKPLKPIKFVQAANFTPCGERFIDWIIIHDMEMPERGDTAEACARFFAGQPKNNKGTSASYAIDNNSIVQCVLDHDIPWAAPGANTKGIHLEHAGYANQRAVGWADPYSDAELRLSAQLVEKLCRKYSIPIVQLTPAQMRAGKLGIAGHATVTKAFPGGSHTDPGPTFPWERYLDYVHYYRAGRVPPPIKL